MLFLTPFSRRLFQSSFKTFVHVSKKGRLYHRDPAEALDRLKENAKELFALHGSPNLQFANRVGNKQEFWMKKTRQMYLLDGCFQAQKHIIPVKRLRNPEDTMMGLKSKGEIAITIEGREEFKEFHFVAELNLLRKLHHKPHYKVKPYYIKYDGDLIRCILSEYDLHPYHHTLRKVTFKRYIPGRPNLLTLPVKVVARDYNKYMNLYDCAYNEDLDEDYDIWCFNEDYKPIVEIDSRICSPTRPLRVLDIANALPEGMYLHRKYDFIRWRVLIRMEEAWAERLAATQCSTEGMDHNKYVTWENQMKSDKAEEVKQDADEEKQLMYHFEEQKKEKELKNAKKFNTIPLRACSAKKLAQIKKTGATSAALREYQSKNARRIKTGDAKEEKKPKKAEKKPQDGGDE